VSFITRKKSAREWFVRKYQQVSVGYQYEGNEGKLIAIANLGSRLSLVNCLIWLVQGLETGGGILQEKFCRAVRLATQNPYPIYDQYLRFSIPYS